MKNLAKPLWYKPLDFLLLVIPGALITLLLIVLSSDNVTTTDGNPLPGGTVPMIGVTAGVALAAVAYRFVSRYLEWRKWTYVPGEGFAVMVKAGEYNLDEDALEEETLRVLLKWARVYGTAKVHKAAEKGVIWVDMRELPMKYFGRAVAGYTYLHSRKMVVGYKTPTQPIGETAYGHELGHVIQGAITGDWDEEAHHKVAEAHELQ